MVKRKNRLKKGINSLDKQIILYEKKLEKAIEEGKIELADYYKKELKAKARDKEKKEKLVRK